MLLNVVEVWCRSISVYGADNYAFLRTYRGEATELLEPPLKEYISLPFPLIIIIIIIISLDDLLVSVELHA